MLVFQTTQMKKIGSQPAKWRFQFINTLTHIKISAIFPVKRYIKSKKIKCLFP